MGTNHQGRHGVNQGSGNEGRGGSHHAREVVNIYDKSQCYAFLGKS